MSLLDAVRRCESIRRNASLLLAFCDMRTLYLRNVPDEVVRRLGVLAARESMSVSALAVRELAVVARWADNAALLGDLPNADVTVSDVVADVREGRAER
jgi:hypothetical protein